MDELGDEEAKGIISWTMGKARLTRTKKKLVWSSELSPDNQDDQDQDQGSSPSKDMISVIDCLGELGEDRGMGTNDGKTGRLNVGFVNCRGWWSREVDLKLVMG